MTVQRVTFTWVINKICFKTFQLSKKVDSHFWHFEINKNLQVTNIKIINEVNTWFNGNLPEFNEISFDTIQGVLLEVFLPILEINLKTQKTESLKL